MVYLTERQPELVGGFAEMHIEIRGDDTSLPARRRKLDNSPVCIVRFGVRMINQVSDLTVDIESVRELTQEAIDRLFVRIWGSRKLTDLLSKFLERRQVRRRVH